MRAQRGDVIEYLVRNGADINSPDSRGKTVLEKSIELNNSDLEFLIQKLKRDQVPWLELKPNGKWPIPRSNHSSSIYNNRWFMYGGGDSFKTPTTIFSDLFMLNGNTLEWRSLKPKGEEFSPPPLFSHTSVVLGKNLLIFGGNDSEKTFNDIHVLDIGFDFLYYIILLLLLLILLLLLLFYYYYYYYYLSSNKFLLLLFVIILFKNGLLY